jgi:hypothetical protein
MPIDQVRLNKAAIIERCIRRMREEYSISPANEKFPIPTQGQYAEEYHRIEKMLVK